MRRAFAGGVAINVEVSPWLIFITFVLAMFLVLARRRHELIALGNDAIAHIAARWRNTVSVWWRR